MNTGNPALNTYLEPLDRLFEGEGVNEIIINRPSEVWVEKNGTTLREEVPALDLQHLRGLSHLVAQSTEQSISEEFPLLSGTLPNKCRIQIVLPPACEPGTIVMSIRKPSVLQLSLDDYEEMGAFSQTATTSIEDPLEDTLKALIAQKKIKDFLKTAILGKKNIIISGGTSTGKTTFTNAALRTIPSDERLLTVEDAREVQLPDHPNRAHLIASKGGQGRAKVTTQDLIEACLRLRPDRIIVGELRGGEAFSFLRAINTGHPGSISTLHADTPLMAVQQLKFMVQQSPFDIPFEILDDYIFTSIDVIIQLKRGKGGIRFISEILFTSDLRKSH